MNPYSIKSPSGQIFHVIAESIYAAIAKVIPKDNFRFTASDYLKLNK